MRHRMAAAFAVALVCCRSTAAETPWTIAIAGGGEYTVAPASGKADALPSIDVRLLAHDLNLSVAVTGDRASIRDSDGRDWSTATGSSVLESRTATRPLARPAIVTQASVTLPIESIAALAGRRLVVDGRRVVLLRSSDQPTSLIRAREREVKALSAPPQVPAGWDRVEFPKTVAELAEMERLEGDTADPAAAPRLTEVQPPAHQALALDLGLGVAQGASGAADISGSGMVANVRVNLATFVTFGQGGATYRAGRVVLQNQDARWMLEAGDLLSDIRGLARGIRMEKAVTSWWHPAIAVYSPNRMTSLQDRAAFAYRDDVRLPGGVELRGEALSDGAVFGGLRWRVGRSAFDAFYRRVPDRRTLDRGASASYDVWRGVTAQFGATLSTGVTHDRWYFGGVSVPVGQWATATFERTARGGELPGASTVGVQLPIGAMHVMQRYQWNDDLSTAGGPNAIPTSLSGTRQMQSVASYAPVRNLQLSYQLARQWSQTSVRQWTEMQAVVAVSRSTSVHAVTGIFDAGATDHFRVGLDQRLGSGFRLTLDYGHLPGYQAPLAPSTAGDAVRFVAMIHRALTPATPAGGREVRGHVSDGDGRPVAGAAVRLGPYVTMADVDGAYRFAHVPAGEFEASIDPDHLPAGYASSTPQRRTRVGDRDVILDWQATRLMSIEGHVFRDGNGNGLFDPGEGVSDVVMRLDSGQATATDGDGAYAFHDLAPGRYEVEIDPERLDRTLAVASGATLAIELSMERRDEAADFIVVPRTKPVVIQEWLP